MKISYKDLYDLCLYALYIPVKAPRDISDRVFKNNTGFTHDVTISILRNDRSYLKQTIFDTIVEYLKTPIFINIADFKGVDEKTKAFISSVIEQEIFLAELISERNLWFPLIRSVSKAKEYMMRKEADMIMQGVSRKIEHSIYKAARVAYKGVTVTVFRPAVVYSSHGEFFDIQQDAEYTALNNGPFKVVLKDKYREVLRHCLEISHKREISDQEVEKVRQEMMESAAEVNIDQMFQEISEQYVDSEELKNALAIS